MQDHNTPVPATMDAKIIIVFLALIQAEGCSARTKKIETRYDPTWESLDSRPLPIWYDEAKVGIFVSLGMFSVPSFGNEWFWERWQGDKDPMYVQYMQDNYRPDFTYADFASDFTAEFYDAESWAELFAASGAKYIVYISKYCDGFCNWATNVSFNWNSMMVGPKRDLVGEMAQALKSKTDLHLNHCLVGWFHPLYLQDKANIFTTTKFVLAQITPELYELVNNYKPDIVWSDGDQEAPDTYWGSKEFLTWLYNDRTSLLAGYGKGRIVTNAPYSWVSRGSCNAGVPKGRYFAHRIAASWTAGLPMPSHETEQENIYDVNDIQYIAAYGNSV